MNLSKPCDGWVLIPTQAGKEESEIQADERATLFPSSQTCHLKKASHPPMPEDEESEKAFFQCKLI